MQVSLRRLRCFSTSTNSGTLAKDLAELVARTVAPTHIPTWTSLVTWAEDSRVSERPLRIGVYGHEDSLSQDVVTAVLQDTLWKDETQQLLEERWKDSRLSTLSIRYGHSPKREGPILTIPSPRLRDWNAELIEIRSSYIYLVRLVDSNPTADTEPLTSLLKTDIPVLIHPHSFPSETHTHPATLMVVNSTSPSAQNHIVTVDSRKALDGRKAFASGEVERFQSLTKLSGFTQLAQALEQALKSDPGERRRTTSQHVFQSVLDACAGGIQAAQRDKQSASDTLVRLEATLQLETDRAQSRLLKSPVVDADAQLAFLHGITGRLKWWRFWRVDDIQYFVAQEIRDYCPDLERRLLYDAGHLSAVQDVTDATTRLHLSNLPSSFQSPILDNIIAQTDASPNHPVPALALMAPLFRRRTALQTQLAPHLQSLCQRAIFYTGSASVLSAGSAGWLWTLGTLDVSGAAGFAVLGTLLAVRYGVGRWEKACRRFVQDGLRLGERLERDVGEQLDRTMREKVLALPTKAVEGLKGKLAKRTEDIQELEESVKSLQKRIDAL